MLAQQNHTGLRFLKIKMNISQIETTEKLDTVFAIIDRYGTLMRIQ